MIIIAEQSRQTSEVRYACLVPVDVSFVSLVSRLDVDIGVGVICLTVWSDDPDPPSTVLRTVQYRTVQ